MSWHWKELLPIDRYCVRTDEKPCEGDQKVLSLLYQPLIGSMAVSLYMTLASKLEKDSYWSDESNHQELMLVMGAPLNQIFEERRKLEGIGLLRTYKQAEEGSSLFIYELQAPMSPKQFFQNDVLSVFLYNRLGKEKYRKTRDRFMLDTIDESSCTEITSSFNEVFASLHHSEMVMQNQEAQEMIMAEEKGKGFAQRPSGKDPFLDQSSFDFELLKADLPAFIKTEDILSEEAKDAIARLAFVYRLGPLEMSKLIQQSLVGGETLEISELRKKVQDWYRFEYGPEPPALAYRTHPAKHRIMEEKEPVTEEEKMIHFYESTSPVMLLESISDGAKVPLADIKIVESLILEYRLQPGVVNVLIDYVMKTNNMKLNKTLIQKIAGHWSRKQLNTVKEAMNLAKEENKSKKALAEKANSKQGAASGNSRPYRPQVRKDKLPKWLTEEQESKEKVSTDSGRKEMEIEKQRFEEMMRKRHENRKNRGES
ncbi:replication initiation and membrane attachment family protein [Thalassobacillus sp. C254]|uniref:replication initiation and membrane attachment family protein n=1 Tax=Thalassobacillus sp. C254 TaxID=1225341 RepID=UPI0006D02EA9|nr:DnaD domain protein [Thalassobacillus sp. C254]